jgi:hypothetical protein
VVCSDLGRFGNLFLDARIAHPHKHCGVGVITAEARPIRSFHRVSIKHLHRYLTEFEYRFNERSNEARFVKTIQRLLQRKTMRYKALTGPTEA